MSLSPSWLISFQLGNALQRGKWLCRTIGKESSQLHDKDGSLPLTQAGAWQSCRSRSYTAFDMNKFPGLWQAHCQWHPNTGTGTVNHLARLLVRSLLVSHTCSGHNAYTATLYHCLAIRPPPSLFATTRMSNLTGRLFHGRFTFYDVGLGACGKYSKATDYVVALNAHQYGGGYPGPNYFRPIHVTYGGQTADAVIVDLCPECPDGALDLSRGLFDHFANEEEGVVYGQWWFTDEGGGRDRNPVDDVDEQSTKTTARYSKPHRTKTSQVDPTASSNSHTSPSIHKTFIHKPAQSLTLYLTHAMEGNVGIQTATASSISSITSAKDVASGLSAPTVVSEPSHETEDMLGLLNNAVVYLAGVVRGGVTIQ